jgi:hypothetical protein
MERRDALQAARSKRGITVSALTNADAADISQAIRERLKAGGELGSDESVHEAVDQRGEQYNLAIATGDRLRLFRRTWAQITARVARSATMATSSRWPGAGPAASSSGTGTAGLARWSGDGWRTARPAACCSASGTR